VSERLPEAGADEAVPALQARALAVIERVNGRSPLHDASLSASLPRAIAASPTLVLRALRCTLRRVEATGLDAIVARSPEVMSGALVFRGTRVLVKTLLDHLAAGESLDEFLDQFPTVKREQATALLSAAEALIQARLDEDPAR
jgi:uncharacterized protein (DUF433 family)